MVETTKKRRQELCQEAAAGNAPKSRTFSRGKPTDFCKKKVNVPSDLNQKLNRHFAVSVTPVPPIQAGRR